jgi:NADPH:quinone reductase-like Zn-dependent oxidoreductase
VTSPSIAESPAHLECRIHREVPLGEPGVPASEVHLVVAEVICVTLDESICTADFRIDQTAMASVGRMGFPWFTTATPESMTVIPRYTYEEFLDQRGGVVVRAIVHDVHGDVDVLREVTWPDPEPGPGEVLVAVRATSLNRLDVIQRAGPPLLPGFRLPHIAGMDVAGDVVAAGPGVTAPVLGSRVLVNPALQCGQCEWCRRGDDGFCPDVRVVGGNHPGGYAELCVVPATHVHVLPDSVSYEEAATVPTIWSTAWHGLVEVGKLQIGETVMIHAAASGVSVAAIQLARRMGTRVVATAGTDAKCELALKLGADIAVNNRTDDVVAAARRVTGAEASTWCSTTWARPVRAVDVRDAASRPARVLRLHQRHRGVVQPAVRLPLRHPAARQRPVLLRRVRPHARYLLGRRLHHRDRQRVSPRRAGVREAQRRLEQGDVIGKVVLQP